MLEMEDILPWNSYLLMCNPVCIAHIRICSCRYWAFDARESSVGRRGCDLMACDSAFIAKSFVFRRQVGILCASKWVRRNIEGIRLKHKYSWHDIDTNVAFQPVFGTCNILLFC